MLRRAAMASIMGRRITMAQRRAMLWLQPGWQRGDAGHSMSAALRSLRRDHPDLVSVATATMPSGAAVLLYRLTDAGELVRGHMLYKEAVKDGRAS